MVKQGVTEVHYDVQANLGTPPVDWGTRKRAISCPFYQPLLLPQSLGTHAVPEPAAKNGLCVNSIETNVSVVPDKGRHANMLGSFF